MLECWCKVCGCRLKTKLALSKREFELLQDLYKAKDADFCDGEYDDVWEDIGRKLGDV